MSWKSAVAQQIQANNTTVQPTVRNILQQLRNDGLIEFVDDRGNYRRLR